MKLELTNVDLRRALRETLVYHYTLSESELSATPNITSCSPLEVTIESIETDFGYEVNIDIYAEAKIHDDYSFKNEDFTVENSDTLTINEEDPEYSDVEMDRNKFDLAPIILALYYDCVPIRYHKDEEIHTADYEVITEETYYKRKKEREREANNPFGALLDEDEE